MAQREGNECAVSQLRSCETTLNSVSSVVLAADPAPTVAAVPGSLVPSSSSDTTEGCVAVPCGAEGCDAKEQAPTEINASQPQGNMTAFPAGGRGAQGGATDEQHQAVLPEWTGNQTAFYGASVYRYNVSRVRGKLFTSAEVVRRRLVMVERLWHYCQESGEHPGGWLLAVAYVDRFLAVHASSASRWIWKKRHLVICAARLGYMFLGEAQYGLKGLSERDRHVWAGSLVTAERKLAKALGYNFRIPTRFDFLRYFQSVLALSTKNLSASAAFSAIALTSPGLMRFHPALVTAAAVVLASGVEMLPRVTEIALFSESEIRSCVGELADYTAKTPTPFMLQIARYYDVTLPFSFELRQPAGNRASPIANCKGHASTTPEKAKEAAELISRGRSACGAELGGGTYGKVYKLDVCAGRYATKIYQSASDGLSFDFLVEASVLMGACSDRVVGVQGGAGITDGHPFIIMELCESDLASLMRSWPASNTEVVLGDITTFTRDILRGLGHLHSVGVVTCDLKPANVLIKKGAAKLADFGIARWQTPPERRDDSEIYTEPYRPPEHLLGMRVAAPSSDMWALGCVVLAMARREPPFGEEGKTFSRILSALGRPAGKAEAFYADLARNKGVSLDVSFRCEKAISTDGLGEWLSTIVKETIVYDPDARTPATILLRNRSDG